MEQKQYNKGRKEGENTMTQKDILDLPFQVERPEEVTDALRGLYIRVNRLINYTGEVLLTAYIAEGSTPPSDIVSPRARVDYLDRKISVPLIQVDTTKWASLEAKMLERLFYTSLVQLASHYEMFLTKLAEEIYLNNDLIKECERKLTVAEVMKFRDFDELTANVIKDLTTDLVHKSYPNIVSSYEHGFHIGIHDKTSPISLPVVHNLIELRNVVVHNDGHASKLYLERTLSYKEQKLPKVLTYEYESLEIDFPWLIDTAKFLLRLGNHIDQQARKRWKTSVTAH
jgi:hypothetical protein